MPLPRIALTVGEPAGIGPDITLQLVDEAFDAELVAFVDPLLMQERAKLLGLDTKFQDFNLHEHAKKHVPGTLVIQPLRLPGKVVCGQLDRLNANYVLESIKLATQACLSGQFDALVTAPVNKAIINQAGHNFSGHTEYIGNICKIPQPLMMLANDRLRVALVTTHLALSRVSEHITPARLEQVIRIATAELSRRFGLSSPNLLVCGLNPHAGEQGEFGTEEIDTIIPTLERLRKEGFQLTGPVPADTAFTPASLQGIDLVVAIYHDQGLPVLKAQGFGETVNITLGLPIIRTSVDHGTALDLAGTGKARADSLRQAIQQAINLAGHA